MDRATEERWRAALKKKGMDAMRAELDLRPGRPTDPVYDIGDGPPYPTRAYCEEWCRGAPPPRMGPSGAAKMVIIMSILVVVCVIRALSSLSPADANWLSDNTVRYDYGKPPAPRGGSSGSDDGIQNNATQNSSAIHAPNSVSTMPSCTSVASAGDLRTVNQLRPCDKLGKQSVQQNTAPHG
jgi:hypothetical protein